MPFEIERKFLVETNNWKGTSKGTFVRQGYLCFEKETIVRIRTYNNKGYLTIKAVAQGLARPEYEYEIPYSEASEILDNVIENPIIEKYRYSVEFNGFIWSVDEFLGENSGLVIAEIELDTENQTFEKPDWIGGEVTGDTRYYNSNLVNNPFRSWNK